MVMLGKGVNRAGYCVWNVMIDDSAVCTILLIGDVHCGLCCCIKCGQRCIIGYDVVCLVIESDVTDMELLCLALIIAYVANVLANL